MSERIFNRIAMLRAERKVSRRELADALGVHYQTVGYLERGEYAPSLHLALRIAAYFEVPVEVVFSTTLFPRLGSGGRADFTGSDDHGSGGRRAEPRPPDNHDGGLVGNDLPSQGSTVGMSIRWNLLRYRQLWVNP